MKHLIYLILVLFHLAGCTTISEVENIKTIDLSDSDVDFNGTAEQTTEDTEQTNETSEQEKEETEQINETAEQTAETREELVKIIGVSEDERKCILSIRGTPVVINKGSSQTVNGITVHVLDVIAVHSQTKDDDLCEIIVS